MNAILKKALTITVFFLIFLFIMLALGYWIYPQILPGFILEIINGPEVQTLTIQDQDALSGSDLEKSRRIAQHFYNPNRFCMVYDLDGPDFDLGATGQDQPFYVRIVGRIQAIFEVENLLSKDWQQAYVFKIRSDEAETLVVYRGSIDHIIANGEYVHVEGVYVIDQGIHADIILPIGPVLGSYRQQQILFFGWLGLGCLILCLLVLIITKDKQQIVISVVLLMFLLSGCELNIETVINRNQSGTFSMSIRESRENFDFSREIPGMADYFESLWAQLRDQGVLVETLTDDQQEEIFIQKKFGGFQELMSQSIQSAQSDTWIYVRVFETDQFSIIRYYANIDTSSMLVDDIEIDAAIRNEIDKLLNEIDFKYRVTMPDRLSYHNGKQENNYKGAWQLRMNDINQIIIESISFKGTQSKQPVSQCALPAFIIGVVPISTNVEKYSKQLALFGGK